jgi:hypothetical protein
MRLTKSGLNLVALILPLLFVSLQVTAQHQELNEQPNLWKSDSSKPDTRRSLLQAFQQGKANGHFRSFLLGTDNAEGLSDYYALAVGGGLRYETAPYHHLQFAVSGFYIFDLRSSDLSKPDPASGQLSRYELGLFDVENPGNKKDLDRLEELYLKYSRSNLSVVFGKQLINTPFINLQDGRMRPTGVEGLHIDYKPHHSIGVEGGVLYAVSPRSTTRFYTIGESIGVYSPGVGEDGKKSGYPGNLDSRYVSYLALKASPRKGLQAQVWQMYVDRLFYTAMQQVDWTSNPRKSGHQFKVGVQAIQQFTVGNGGHSESSHAYRSAGSRSFTFGAMAGWQKGSTEFNVNYNRITAHGRYLMPREWGRDPFYTFLPRERNEGYGDVHAWMARISRGFPKAGWRFSLAGGVYRLPDVKNFRLNKYGMPSYAQVNADIRYRFRGWLQGLDAQFLFVAKPGMGHTYNEARYRINKVDMMQYNLVLNYRF